MKFHNFRYSYQHLLQKFALVGVACFCLTSWAEAASVMTTRDSLLGKLSSDKTLIAQENNVCPEKSGRSRFVSAETKNFLVYICGGDEPNTYVSIAKKGGNNIVLPLFSYNEERFVAVNRDTRYILTRKELTVVQNGRVILRERAQWKQ
ncbi:hypothetical protein [Allocoleopsis franciscana]|uniref:Uncharacterized protein n=1 Tax=Allocoleopsis franciscana PCC 7113 TaxID=1173027 RepID=K9WJ45_9CYAN|nr:hypothetical protein [Allocoleopsis franciscana]AFZ19542.1 hypothetical protein Mic7113_3825 [Allocoleopsis franciscana PCC 7113]